MWNVLVFFILLFIPIPYLIAYTFKQSHKCRIPGASQEWTLLLVLVVILCIAFFPEELSTDKFRYVRGYYWALNGSWVEFRDYGWVLYNHYCGIVFGTNIDCFFALTAILYVGSYYIWARNTFPKRYIAYFLVMSIGCLGFSNYGTNVIRAGLALSILIVAANIRIKWYYKLLLIVVSLSFHKSMIIPVVAFLGAKSIKSEKAAGLIWLGCLLVSAMNVGLGPLFETVGFVDERVENYYSSIGEEEGGYNKGFRVDFLFYSMIPIVIAIYYLFYKKIKDAKYIFVFKMYLYSNAIWLLVIRMAYTDRIAYFSWFLIPFLCLYPAILYQKSFKSPRWIVLTFMSIFMFTNILLSLRRFL